MFNKVSKLKSKFFIRLRLIKDYWDVSLTANYAGIMGWVKFSFIDNNAFNSYIK